MNDVFFLGLFIGTVIGPVVLVLLFLVFAVATSWMNRKDTTGGNHAETK